jgi:hypothetical protein
MSIVIKCQKSISWGVNSKFEHFHRMIIMLETTFVFKMRVIHSYLLELNGVDRDVRGHIGEDFDFFQKI